MTSREIRQSFLDFFKSKQHTIVPSSSLLPDAPNLLFTNAGMNQFVPIFLGQVKCPYTPGRAADTQKCIRAGGKHNDLEDVGLDTYHHTFFEMLGNWSFGDYFKKEAIEWAWELVTSKEWWGFPKERLYATVYQPGPGEPSEFDQEAYDHWARLFTAAGLDPKVHICTGGKQDNFWMMGDTGPCGPCSELHVDLTPNGDTQGKLVNAGSAQCIEIWNLVFMQFNANPDGTFSPLPAKSVDTGMGFERVTGIIQNTKGFTDFNRVISNYETDIFRPIFDKLEQLCGKKYGSTLPGLEGGTGDSPVPLGDPPSGTAATSEMQMTAGLQSNVPAYSAGPVAQRHGQVARATQSAPGATYSRRNLPHFEKPWAIYYAIINTIAPRKLSPATRDIVFDCILHWRESRYRLVAACVMPDHAHFIIQPGVKEEDPNGNPIFWPLSEILHSIKSYSAKEVNKLDHVKGTLWQEERYDRYMRSDANLQEKFHYICRNPWASGLVRESEPWPWLWTPDIEASKPYVPVSARQGSTGDPPVPLGDPPSGTAAKSAMQSSAGLQSNAPAYSAGPVAQRHGQVARATHERVAIDIAFRVIADHIRTLGLAIADGIQPGNTDRNYVLRRILRRAVRYGRTLGFHEPFFYKLVDVLAETMGDVFPEIRAKQKHVQEVIRTEEVNFNRTLDEGIRLFDGFVAGNREARIQAREAESAVRKLRDRVAKLPDSQPTYSLRLIRLRNDFMDLFMDMLPGLPNLSGDGSTAVNSAKLADPRVEVVMAINSFGALIVGAAQESAKESDYLELIQRFEQTSVQAQDKLLEIANRPDGISGVAAFTLYDTYGFPLDLTELMARERGLTVDVEGFNKLMDEQKARARAAQKKTVIELSQIETQAPTAFVGYDKLETPAKVLEVVQLKDQTAVILDTSACYAEMGGQVGDTGELEHGAQLWRVVNTQKSGNTWLHFIEEGVEQATSLFRPATGRTEAQGATMGPGRSDSQSRVSAIPVGGSPTGTGESPVLPVPGAAVTLTVDRTRRHAIERHHTVTHLLHWALHEVVSRDAAQKGSFVGPDKFTFDFNSAPLTPQQVAEVEKLVNERILENAGVSWTQVPYADVKSRKDVMQFFGEKYGDVVRVVQIGGQPAALDGYSMELCGGTHTRATGEIGLFRIVGENAIAAGVRRIEAIAGLTAYDVTKLDRELIKAVAGKVNSPVHELEKKIESLLEQQKALEKQLKGMQQKEAVDAAQGLVAKATTIHSIPAIIENMGSLDGDALQALVNELKGQFKGVIVLGGVAGSAVALVASVSPEFTTKVQAGKIIQQIAPMIGGKGGGKPDHARGGGKDVTKLDEALAKAKSLLQ